MKNAKYYVREANMLICVFASKTAKCTIAKHENRLNLSKLEFQQFYHFYDPSVLIAINI